MGCRALALVAPEPADGLVNRAELRASFARRDALAAELRALDANIAAASRRLSDEDGYPMTLRPQQVRHTIGI